jgi:hypothetical protein
LGEPFTINIIIIRNRLAAKGRKKLVGPDGVPGEILTLVREAMIPYFSLFLDIINISTIPSVRKRATVVPIYQGGQRSAVTDNRTVSLTSVVCQQMEHVIAGHPRQVWDTNK